ncbi:trifunctional transcriptional regulator/proline dehydrogenase/L-glutamate gamma-semialdehyde dehydrogenase [Brenneria tiliae]|uniref:trifunctional transcriptional regulator/proline dehydrogenase/L-glutamate gamma-semialdehyde dehydrogenase n=1 Tax=Brenneria tiliae TaxID=2914984 RepID=UPI002014FE51|nr:trifunctional transcriptional regulator/proline dehydrogenase/L-glutamate gamma-semialdehyde dehydrogenase [Brenneria tiliae]MCL2896762.1 trifunctional transcriptional regulator/proline dehydrogenase/L-glutamate gamma-semialdehyde dehydrogenase [Brenneria tiliae]MCL2901255.1 trifunctional transcriptional regulator/proline dehydrogenase/L-glutamate gamma-semialdehyde dehydrogenase [Brenneria tiliae]
MAGIDKEASVEKGGLAYQAFSGLAAELINQDGKRKLLTQAWDLSEQDAVSALFNQVNAVAEKDRAIHKLAHDLASSLRKKKVAKNRAAIVQNLLQEYSLSSREGIALMCLAEALLRIPDNDTRDLLISDKISGRDWKAHIGKNRPLFVNAASWGLVLTDALVSYNHKPQAAGGLKKIIRIWSPALLRKAMNTVMHVMSEHFVTGETITQALEYSEKIAEQGFTYTYDMLGEAALTQSDAQDYIQRCRNALHEIGKRAVGKGIYSGPEFSLKLSALHPRYTRHQYHRVLNEIYPELKSLVILAKEYNVAITIDAEEAERLDISLDLLTKLCHEPELQSWNGIGFVVQAYQKRCYYVIDFLKTLAKTTGRRLRVRLVKGAYWDSEIKRAQIAGHKTYPVFTRKVYSDISYLACAGSLLSEPELIYPQFATHNAQTLAAVYHIAGDNFQPEQYEFQCLHGMGVPLYQEVVGKAKLDRPCRIYAPVGSHETLLPYLVRRLLENGSNSSFVNKIADLTIPLDDLVASPVHEVENLAQIEHELGLPHPKIPLPRDIYGASRANSAGLNLYDEDCLHHLSHALTASSAEPITVTPLIAAASALSTPKPIINPAESRDIIGQVYDAGDEDIAIALAAAEKSAAGWAAVPPSRRAQILQQAAEIMEQRMGELIGVLVREAGKTYGNAIAEVREAIDFLNYYAGQVNDSFDNQTHTPLGVVVCISPWNFPLAIFTGQVAAALAAGNTVIAKPAEQTPLNGYNAVKILHQAGIPVDVLQLLPGRGETIGQKLIADDRVKGIMFTGSTEVASFIQRQIAGRVDASGRPIPLIAETGGINALIVDSSALPEQVILDSINSAFDSAGQRCSALRLICIQNDVADRLLNALRGAMAEYRMGNPERLSSDIGPVIDAEAMNNINSHIKEMADKGFQVHQRAANLTSDDVAAARGCFIAPTLIEINHLDELQKEVFGPVLHVLRYHSRQLPSLVEKINASGYGLTFGLHSRIDSTIDAVTKNIKAGNIYINRNIVGAVVGVQPFGGEGLSGTGPKAGGPLYLYRLLAAYPADAQLKGLNYTSPSLPEKTAGRTALLAVHTALSSWLEKNEPAVYPLCEQFIKNSASFTISDLPGPTGEANSYRLLPRERVLCLAQNRQDILVQLAAITSIGGKALWPDEPHYLEIYGLLPDAVRQVVDIEPLSGVFARPFDAVIHHGDADSLQKTCRLAAERGGPIVSVQGLKSGETDIRLERLLIERSVSVNTAAAGGNTQLMTID